MQDQPICKLAGDEPADTERNVLCLLLESPTPGPWSVDELTRELGNDLLAVDAIVGLHAAGLVHRCHELVFPTRAAVRFNEIARSTT